MLRWRLFLGTIIIAAMVGLCWLDCTKSGSLPGVWLLPLALAAAVLATQETLRLASLGEMRPMRWPVYVGNVLLVTANWAVALQWMKLPAGRFNGMLYGQTCLWTLALLSAFGISVLLVFFAEMVRYEKPGGNMKNLAGGIFSLVYVGLLLSFAVQLRLFWGIAGIVSWIVVVKMGDTGAYTVGRLIGRHKMSPRISPGKTIEGAFGAVAFSCFGAWFTFCGLPALLTPNAFITFPTPWWSWLVFGVVVGIAGLLGDLAESFLKRDVGVKDSSSWMPGFGGALDILDSLLLSAPIAWLCWASGLVGK
jgi:phosphatidate cytidylyltransferase